MNFTIAVTVQKSTFDPGNFAEKYNETFSSAVVKLLIVDLKENVRGFYWYLA